MAASPGTLYVPINDMNNTRNGDYLDPELARPGVHAMDPATGKLLWSNVRNNVCREEHEFCDPGVSAPVTALPGAVVAGHLDGFIQVYDEKTGEVIWSYDSRPPFQGVNGLTGHGGSVSGAGAAIADGHIVINVGYGLYNHQAGNLLLVIAPGKVTTR